MKLPLRVAAAALTLTAASLFASPARADSDWVPFPLVRTGFGARLPIDQDPLVDTGFAMDGALGVTMSIGRKSGPLDTAPNPEFQLSPHIGLGTGPGTFAFAAGMGVGGGISLFTVAYEPQLLAGQWTDPNTEEDFALVGMRNSGTLGLFFNIISLEVGHEFDYYAGSIHQSVVVTGRVDLGALLPVIIMGLMSGMN